MQVVILEVPVLYITPETDQPIQEYATGFFAVNELISPRFIARVTPCTVGDDSGEDSFVARGVKVYMSNMNQPILIGLPYDEFKKRLAAGYNLGVGAE